MQTNIDSYNGFGKAKFGMTREAIHDILGKDYQEFSKTADDTQSDYYKKDGIMVYYSDDNQCEAIEVFKPCKANFKNVDLLDFTKNDAIEYLKQFDSKIIIESDGFTSLQLGIGGYCSNPNSDSLLEAIICFKKDYYRDLY